MEVLFENVYTDSEEMMMELYHRASRRNRYIWLAVYLLLIIWYINMIMSIDWLILWAGLIFLIAYSVYLLCVPMINTKRYFKRVRQYHDGMVPQTQVQFTEKKILVENGRSSQTVPYDKLDKAWIMKHCIRLDAGKMALVAIKPECFTKGTAEEFMQFLREKCPDLKIIE